jgi:tripartite-type tricarboxylate transporter receptor subunit TctC
MNAIGRVRIVVLLAAVCLAAVPSVVLAQADYPSRPIKIVVPLPPGGTADILPRIIGEKLSARWGQPVVIENRAGGGQHIGTEAVARAEPDGYTLLASAAGPLVINPSLYPNLSYDPAAFAPVTIMASLPYVLVVHPKVPVTSVAELVAYAKANPDKLNYAAPGGGSQTQLAVEWLKILSATKMTFVPYKGSVPALADLVAGHVDLMFDNLGNSLQHIRAGRLRALAVASEKRLPEFPDLPTMAETFPGFIATSWFALLAPPKTPAPIVDKLHAAIAEILRMPDVEARLHGLGAAPGGPTPAATAAFLRQETARWSKVIAEANIKPE